MIVRLKEGLLQMDNRIRLSFQFYDSPIKREERMQEWEKSASFNSMIVRLKGRFGQRRGRKIRKFQFYDSPIKRVRKGQTN